VRARTLVAALILAAAGPQFDALAQPADSAGTSGYQPRTLSPAPPKLEVVEQGKGVSVTQRGRGTLLVVADTWDFGFVPQDAHVMHRYLLQNSGDDTLFIEQVKPTCGCTVASLEKNRLAPGEKVPVDVTVGTANFSGLLKKKVHVISSDKESSLYVLSFQAQVGPAPGLEWPEGASVNFDRIAAGEHGSSRLPFTNRGSTVLHARILEPPPAYLKATISPESVAPGSTAQLVLETRSNPPRGAFKGSVTLELAGSQTTRLTIPFSGVGVEN
jgi:hypothetical protein